MRRNYGFNIPQSNYCTDIEGLLAYLGEKIGIGNFSIWDDKHFGSVTAVQQHMVFIGIFLIQQRDTGTCKMRWEDNEEEYADFYDLETIFEREENMRCIIFIC